MFYIMERARRIQLPPSVWKTEVLALNYARILSTSSLRPHRFIKLTVCSVYTHINLLVESSFNILVGIAGLEPARLQVNGFSYYSMSPQPHKMRCSLEYVFTISYDLGGWYILSTHLQQRKLLIQLGVLCLPSPNQPTSTLKVSSQALSTITRSHSITEQKHIKVRCVCHSAISPY